MLSVVLFGVCLTHACSVCWDMHLGVGGIHRGLWREWWLAEGCVWLGKGFATETFWLWVCGFYFC